MDGGKLEEVLEIGEEIVSSLHSDMRVLYGYLHDNMEKNQTAVDAMVMVETMHDRLYELAQEFASARGGEVIIKGLV